MEPVSKKVTIIYTICAIIYLIAIVIEPNLKNPELIYSDTAHFISHTKYQYTNKNCTPSLYQISLLRQILPPIRTKVPRYLLHGLWVEKCSQCPACGFPTFCRNIKFNYTLLRPLYNILQRDWYPGNMDPKKNNLLRHEWNKHGTCTKFTQLQYFNQTLIVYNKLFQSGLISKCYEMEKNECSFYLNKDVAPS